MSRANPRFHRTNAPLATLVTTAVRATFFYTVDQQICLWNLDYIGNGTTYSGTGFEAAMASALNMALGTAIKNCLSSDCFFTTVKVQSLTTPSRQPGFFNLAAANQPGSVAGNHLSSELAAIISKQTAVKGQHGRGRLYLPGIPTGFVTPASDANRLNATGSTAISNLITALVTTTYTDGANVYTPGLTTRVLHGLPVTSGTVLSSMINRLLLGVIRRRRIGRGK